MVLTKWPLTGLSQRDLFLMKSWFIAEECSLQSLGAQIGAWYTESLIPH